MEVVKFYFIKALKEARIKITDIFVIFYYDIFDISKTPLGSFDVKIHSLCTWNDIIEVIKKKDLYSEQQIKNLESFLHNPDKWRAEL